MLVIFLLIQTTLHLTVPCATIKPTALLVLQGTMELSMRESDGNAKIVNS